MAPSTLAASRAAWISAGLAALGGATYAVAECDRRDDPDAIMADLISDEAVASAGLPPSGSFEGLKENKLTIQRFDGFACDISKNFVPDDARDPQLQIAQNFTLGKTDIGSPGGTYYHFVATYISGKTMMQGVMAGAGQVFCTATTKLLDDNLEVRMDGQFVPSQPQMSSFNTLFDYTGRDFHTELKFGRGGGVGTALGFNYFQSVTNDLALGGNVMFLTGPKKLDWDLAGRLNVDDQHSFATTYNIPARLVDCSYSRAVNERLKLFSQIQFSVVPQDPGSEMSCGYEYYVRVEPGPPNPATGQPDLTPYTTIKGQVKSSGRIIIGVEQLTLGGQAKLKLSASMLHSKRDYRFGVGMELQH